MKIAKIQNKKSGFTLLELMVVVAIIGIMSAAGFASLSDGRNQKAVDLEARKVASVLRMAQNYAVSGRALDINKIPCKFIFTSSVAGSYSISYTYRGPTGTCGASEVISTYNVDGNVVITGTTVSFARPRGDANVDAQVGLSRSGAASTVCVVKGGVIKEDC